MGWVNGDNLLPCIVVEKFFILEDNSHKIF